MPIEPTALVPFSAMGDHWVYLKAFLTQAKIAYFQITRVAGGARRDLNQHNDVLMCSNPQIGSFPQRVSKYIVHALN